MFGTSDRSSSAYSIPRFESPRETIVYVQDIEGNQVIYPGPTERPTIIFPSPSAPAVVIHTLNKSFDYYLHPSLRKKRRKRKYL